MADQVREKAVRVRIQGRVQAVWFRAWTAETATAMGLDGWVRNRFDGTVEALFSGPAELVEKMVAACHEGPPQAVVTHVDVTPSAPDPEPGFRALPTD
jgi:acylphosphatase